jgi:hypothetical protein
LGEPDAVSVAVAPQFIVTGLDVGVGGGHCPNTKTVAKIAKDVNPNRRKNFEECSSVVISKVLSRINLHFLR